MSCDVIKLKLSLTSDSGRKQAAEQQISTEVGKLFDICHLTFFIGQFNSLKSASGFDGSRFAKSTNDKCQINFVSDREHDLDYATRNA